MRLSRIRRAAPAMLLSVTLVGCGSQPGAGTAAGSNADSGPATSSTVPAPVIVRRPVTQDQLRRMRDWMVAWRACMAEHGFALPAPDVHPRDVSIDVSAVAGVLDPNAPLPLAPGPFQRQTMRCATDLGGPPGTFLRTAGIVDLFHGTCALAVRRPGD